MGNSSLRIWLFEEAPSAYKMMNKIAEPAEARFVIVVPPGLAEAFDELMADSVFTGYIEPDRYMVEDEQVYVTYE